MSKFIGTAMAASFAGSALPQITEITYSERGDLPRVDVTCATDTAMSYADDLPDLAQVDVTIRGFMESGSSSIVYQIDTNTAAGTLIYYPQGSASGNPTYSGVVKCVSKTLGAPFRQGQTYELGFRKNNGAFSLGTA